MREKITEKVIQKLKPASAPYDVSDTECKGFVLRVETSGSKRYYFRYRPSGGKQTRIKLGEYPARPVDEARKKAEAMRSMVNDGLDPSREQQKAKANTLGGFIDREYKPKYLSTLRSGDETYQRLKACFGTTKEAKRSFWESALKDISPSKVAHWIAARTAEGRANGTINRDVSCLKGVLSKAVEWDFLTSHPLRGKVKPKKTDTGKDARILSLDEETRLMTALDERQEAQRVRRRKHNKWCQDRKHEPWPNLDDRTYTDYLKPMVELSIHTGLRQNEIFSLEWTDVNLREWSDVDQNGGWITVRDDVAKDEDTRKIPINEVAYRVLTIWRNETHDSGLVFPSPSTGDKINNVQTSWERIRKKAKIGDFVWHNLRATFASRLVNSGANLEAVRKMMGHASLDTTRRYLKSDEKKQIEAVARLVRPANVVPFSPKQDAATGTTDGKAEKA